MFASFCVSPYFCIPQFKAKKTDLIINAKLDEVFGHVMGFLDIEVDLTYDPNANYLLKESAHPLEDFSKKSKVKRKNWGDWRVLNCAYDIYF